MKKTGVEKAVESADSYINKSVKKKPVINLNDVHNAKVEELLEKANTKFTNDKDAIGGLYSILKDLLELIKK